MKPQERRSVTPQPL